MSKAETIALLEKMSREQNEMVDKVLEVVRSPRQCGWEASIVSAVLILPVSIAMAGMFEVSRLLISRRPGDSAEADPPVSAPPDVTGGNEAGP